MKKILTIISLIYSTLTYGQNPVSDRNFHQSIDGLIRVDSISLNDILGRISVGDVFGGYRYTLDSNLTFLKIDVGCLGWNKLDSGTWYIQNKNILALKSDKQLLLFDIFRFDKFYFFILPNERQKFLSDLKSTKTKFKNAKTFILDGKTYSTNFIIGYKLSEKYYAADNDHLAGT